MASVLPVHNTQVLYRVPIHVQDHSDNQGKTVRFTALGQKYYTLYDCRLNNSEHKFELVRQAKTLIFKNNAVCSNTELSVHTADVLIDAKRPTNSN